MYKPYVYLQINSNKPWIDQSTGLKLEYSSLFIIHYWKVNSKLVYYSFFITLKFDKIFDDGNDGTDDGQKILWWMDVETKSTLNRNFCSLKTYVWFIREINDSRRRLSFFCIRCRQITYLSMIFYVFLMNIKWQLNLII